MKKYWRLIIMTVLGLSVAAMPFLTADYAAAEDPIDNCVITIVSPAKGAILGNAQVSVTISYLIDTNLTDPPPAQEWKVTYSCRVFQTFDPTLDYSDYPLLEGETNISSSSGEVGFTIDLRGYPPGNYALSAGLIGPRFTNYFRHSHGAESSFSYGAPGAPADQPGVFVPNPPNNGDDNTSSPIGGIIAGILGLGAIGIIISIVRTRIGGSKPPPKTTVPASGGTKTAPPGTKTTPPAGPKRPQSNKDIAEAEKGLVKARKNKALFDRWTRIRNAVYNDSRLYDFVEKARPSIIGANGEINEANLNRLEGLMKNWIKRDNIAPQMPDYTKSDAFHDTVRQASGNIWIRLGAAYLSGGYSEMALNPVSALSNMRQNIMQGDSATWAVTKGFAQSGFELALGEAGRLLKYAKPLVDDVKQSYNMYKLGQINANLKSEISTINQLASQTKNLPTRNAFMKSTDVAKAGKTGSYELTTLEQDALKLNNNAEFRDLMAQNSNLIPANVKEVMGVAKQKVYQQARNDAINDVMNQMAKDGVPTGENPFFIRQTGTHAQPGNPGWNSVKSDFDHTVEFGSSKYNQLYEQKFNSSLEGQGTTAKAIDANVYGEGTSSHGAYTGGAKKFVEHYNETSGSDVMIRNNKGVTTITTETPQSSTSLLSRMNPGDVKSAEANYQKFFQKDIAKGGDLNNQIVNGSKTVSRNAGQYSTKYVQNFQETGKVNYQPPPAAKVADLVKKQGYSVDGAMQKAGYSGSKEQLLNDFKKIMGF